VGRELVELADDVVVEIVGYSVAGKVFDLYSRAMRRASVDLPTPLFCKTQPKMSADMIPI
jgi:hypothetical protein